MEYKIDGAGVILTAHELCHTLWREESVLHRQEHRPRKSGHACGVTLC